LRVHGTRVGRQEFTTGTRRWLASVLRGHYVLRSAEQPGSTWCLL
jgi:hypothetical protein